MKKRVIGLLIPVLALALPVHAEPVKFTTVFENVDWTAGGVAGVGSVGDGTVTISGVGLGTVTRAILYWHGIDQSFAGDGIYDNETIFLDGVQVIGTAIGDSDTNCWGAGSGRSYRSDVTALVPGDGTYELTGLASKAGHSANGASLIVIFDDGDPDNNVTLAFFDGNDADNPGFPGDPAGWAASLPGIEYQSGPVRAQLHVADGQPADDGSVAFSTANGITTINDDATLYDGISLPSENNGRNGLGLWDVHLFEITTSFGGIADTVTLEIDGQNSGSDCLALVALILEFEGAVIPPPTVCRIDADDDVDRNDISLIMAARNQPALGEGDPRDPNQDGVINILDSRLCALECTIPGCSEPVLMLNSLPQARVAPSPVGADGVLPE